MKVWIDTDVSIGSTIREVDDAFALVLAFHSRELEIVGISATYGNAPLPFVDRVARDLMQRFDYRAPVYAGAASPRELGKATAATDALAALGYEHSGLTYIAIGPLTNLASALERHPHLRESIKQVIFVGGISGAHEARPRVGKWLRIHDANAFKDPRAAKIVLSSRIPMLLIPVSAAWKLMIDNSAHRQLAAAGGAAEYLARKTKWWLRFWNICARTGGGPVFDTLAVIAAAQPHLLETEPRFARVDLRTRLMIATPEGDGAPVRFCTGFDSEAKQLLLDRLTNSTQRQSPSHTSAFALT